MHHASLPYQSLIEILANNSHVTIIVMAFKSDYMNNEENNTLFDRIGFQRAEILMLK